VALLTTFTAIKIRRSKSQLPMISSIYISGLRMSLANEFVSV